MSLLRDTRTAPPGGWRYTQPETGLTMDGLSLSELVVKVIRHRSYKGISPMDADDVSEEIQRQICERLMETKDGKQFCRPEPGDGG